MKIIQICCGHYRNLGEGRHLLYALRADGSVWQISILEGDSAWGRLPTIGEQPIIRRSAHPYRYSADWRQDIRVITGIQQTGRHNIGVNELQGRVPMPK